MKTLPGKTTKWGKSNFPGQNERFLKLEKGLKEMSLNFDKMMAAVNELKEAVTSANKRNAVLEAKIAELSSNPQDQISLDVLADDVTNEAAKLPKEDVVGGSTGGITA